ncbi:MAG: GDSL-type esterase/lipase family protein [Fuerstiella sp.]|nr:GDSL-type esterase/lipase family protein [Fuerstiella sp.]
MTDPDSKTDHQPTATPRANAAMRRPKLFRWFVVSVPILAGLIAAVAILVQRDWIVVDRQSGSLQLQNPPLYLQEAGSELTGHKYLYDELLGWKNIPDWKATTHNRELTINSKGLRDREYEYDKPDGVRRILVLGDSYVWGYGVADHEVFTEVLETRLAGDQWQVINSGVSGWGTDQELLFLTDEGFKYSPDVVILAFFFFNDLQNNSSSRQYGLYKPVFVDNSLQPANVPVPKPDSGRAEIYGTLSPIEITARLIHRIADTCEEHQCRFIVMKFGSFLEPDNQALQADGAAMREYLIDHTNMEYLDLDAEFSANHASVTSLIEGNLDGHWNVFGHQLTATIIHDFLTRSGYVDADSQQLIPLSIAD